MSNQTSEMIQHGIQTKASLGAGAFWGFGIAGCFAEYYQLIMGIIAILGLLTNLYYSRANKKINEIKLNMNIKEIQEKAVEEDRKLISGKLKAAGMNEAARHIRYIKNERVA